MKEISIPQFMTLLGRRIYVCEQNEVIYKGEAVEGLYEHSNKRMLIHENQTHHDKFETIIHESAHSYQTQLGIDQTLSEREVEVVCQIMTMFAVDIIRSFSDKEALKKKRKARPS
jgi:hypothetical protein